MVDFRYFLESAVLTLLSVITFALALTQLRTHLWNKDGKPNPKFQKFHKVSWSVTLASGFVGIFLSLDTRPVFGLYPLVLMVIMDATMKGLSLAGGIEWMVSAVLNVQMLRNRPVSAFRSGITFGLQFVGFLGQQCCSLIGTYLMVTTNRTIFICLSLAYSCLWVITGMLIQVLLIVQLREFNLVRAGALLKQSRRMFESEMKQADERFKTPVSRLLLLMVMCCCILAVNLVGIILSLTTEANAAHAFAADPERFTINYISVLSTIAGWLLLFNGVLMSWLPIAENDRVVNFTNAVIDLVWSCLGSRLFPEANPPTQESSFGQTGDNSNMSPLQNLSQFRSTNMSTH